jgi:broad specificity phosphatase PhoE
MNTDLYLVRHGQTATNQARLIQGWNSEPLNARGRWQAERAGERLASAGLVALYASPLRRAAETAEIIGRAVGLDAISVADLREMNTGKASGLNSAQFIVRHPRLWWAWLRDDSELSFPGGDTLSLFYDRAARAINELVAQHRGQTIAVVSHGGAIAGYLSLLLKGRGSNRIALQPPIMLTFNDTAHLREQMPRSQRPTRK